MNRTLIIARKEFKDHVSDHTFLLCFATLLIVMVGGALFMIQLVQYQNFRTASGPYLIEEDAIWKHYDYLFTEIVTGHLSSLGALLAVAMSINAIQKERVDGSLRVLMSYPIYRDDLFMGKLIGGALVLSLVAIVSMVISFSLLVFYLSIPLTIDFLIRIIFTTLIGIMLLVFFLCIGMVVSSFLSDTSSILLILILIVAVLRYETYNVLLVTGVNLLSYFGVRLPKPGFYHRGWFRSVWNDPFYRNVCRISPIESYLKLSESLFHFGWEYEWTPFGTDFTLFSFQDQLLKSLDLVAVQIVFTLVAVAACYIVSTRRELCP